MSGRLFVILFVSVAVVAVIGATIVTVVNRDKAYLNQAGVGLQKVHKAAAVWAEAHDDHYPAHVALLQPNNYFRMKLFRDPRLPEGTVWTVGGLDARPFLSEQPTPEGEWLLDRAPLLNAVAEASDEPFYRFGDYRFVRLPRYENRDDLVFGWTLPDEEGRRFIVFDSGRALRIEADQWDDIWTADAAARKDLGLPPFDPPPADADRPPGE